MLKFKIILIFTFYLLKKILYNKIQILPVHAILINLFVLLIASNCLKVNPNCVFSIGFVNLHLSNLHKNPKRTSGSLLSIAIFKSLYQLLLGHTPSHTHTQKGYTLAKLKK